jgi:NADP-dependent 3-hydroxy acid dehydrogenase YdfG
MPGALDGRVALVTGASSGLGEATALALAAGGAAVGLAARRADRLDALVRRIEAAGGTALALPGDVCDEAFATAAVDRTVEHFGRIDILVNSAGTTRLGTVADGDTDDFRLLIDVNLLATLYTCKAALAHMKPQGSGDIINISSLASRMPVPGMSAYSSSKHALNAMTDGMRMEVGKLGIRVCILMPGSTGTEVADGIKDDKAREGLKAYLNSPGYLKPHDVANAVLYIVTLPPNVNVSDMTIRGVSEIT